MDVSVGSALDIFGGSFPYRSVVDWSKAQAIHHEPGKFYMGVGGAELLYSLPSGSTLNIYHTEVDPRHRGRGLAQELAIAAFEYAKAHGLTVIPSCSYIRDTFLARNPQYASLVSR